MEPNEEAAPALSLGLAEAERGVKQSWSQGRPLLARAGEKVSNPNASARVVKRSKLHRPGKLAPRFDAQGFAQLPSPVERHTRGEPFEGAEHHFVLPPATLRAKRLCISETTVRITFKTRAAHGTTGALAPRPRHELWKQDGSHEGTKHDYDAKSNRVDDNSSVFRCRRPLLNRTRVCEARKGRLGIMAEPKASRKVPWAF